MGIVGIISSGIYWLAKLYFMIFGAIYVLALVGKFDMNLFIHLTGIIGLGFLLSNIYWYLGRKGE